MMQAPDGSEGYTRAGDLKLTAEGVVTEAEVPGLSEIPRLELYDADTNVLVRLLMADDANGTLYRVAYAGARSQGAALTAFELNGHGVPHTVIADNAGGHLMQHGKVDLCIVGSDRTTASGDVCNKIGTYLKALAAHDTGVPFYAALPFSTSDGPTTVTDGVASGFARTPHGAALAAYDALARAIAAPDDTWQQVLEHRFTGTTGQHELLRDRYARSRAETPDAARFSRIKARTNSTLR